MADDLCASKVPGFTTTITTQIQAASYLGVAKIVVPVNLNSLAVHHTIESYLQSSGVKSLTTQLVAQTGTLMWSSANVTQVIATAPHNAVPGVISQSPGVQAIIVPAWCRGGSYTPWKVPGVLDYFSESVQGNDAVIVHNGAGHYTLKIDTAVVSQPVTPAIHLAVTVLVQGPVTTNLSWIHQ